MTPRNEHNRYFLYRDPAIGPYWTAVAELVGTPVYIYDADQISSAIRAITTSIPYSKCRIHYAMVANCNPAILRVVTEAGAGLHANTMGDVVVARHCHVQATQVVVSGSNFAAADLQELARYGARLNCDASDQIEQYTRYRPQRPPGVRLHLKGLAERIGVCQGELTSIAAFCRRNGSTLAGLHVYRGTGIGRCDAFVAVLRELNDAARSVRDLEYIDIGGGFGVDYRDGSKQIDWASFGGEISETARELSEYHGREIEVLIEPGRSVVASAGVLIARIVSVKVREGVQYIGTDASVANLSVPSVFGPPRRCTLLQSRREQPMYTTHVCGATTFSRDFLAKHIKLPRARIGDLVAIHDCGAYAYSMSSHFLNMARPPEVLVENGSVRLIRRRESYADLLSHAEDLRIAGLEAEGSDRCTRKKRIVP